MSVIIVFSSGKEIRLISHVMAERIECETIEIKDLKRKNGIINNIISNYNAVRYNKTNIEPEHMNFDKNNLILIGTPSTMGNPSPAIITFIENNNFKNKNIILFTTTNSMQGHSILNDMKKRIEKKGGIIINSFIMRVNNKSEDELKNNTLLVLHKLDIDLYS